VEPACVKACPTEAITYGEREQLLAEAHRRIAADPTGYVDHVYGEHEVGGTSMLYLAGVPFAALGFPVLRNEPVSAYTEAVMRQTPTIALTVAAGASALYWIIKRRQMNMALAEPVAMAAAADQPDEKSKEVAP
jgi:formate dehydrogenase iron-sulfur subunit